MSLYFQIDRTLIGEARRVRLSLPLLMILAAGSLQADEITKWSETANRLCSSSGMADGHPLLQTRILAMAHIAMHDAVNAIDRHYESYTLAPAVTSGASPEAAAAAAAHAVLLDQFTQSAAFGFPSLAAELNTAYEVSLAAIPDGSAKTLGITTGQAAATRILTLRAPDGAYALPIVDPAYKQGTAPGEYRFTPPFTFVFEPRWGEVPPFALVHSDRFRPNAPYPIDSKRHTDDFNEVKTLGGDGVTTPSARTSDQTRIGLFWVEASPVGWNRIARTVSATAGLTLWENARLFALLNVAPADGYIGSFQAKYQYRFWRPVTAIHEADTDGNNDTTSDKTWTPLVVTYPIPDHDSAHSVEGGAGAEVLERFFGNARIPFRTCSTSLPVGSTCNDPSPVYRSYTSFSQAALENGLSRIYIGIHFRRAVTEGIEHGRKIGHWTFQHYLRPVH